MLLKLLELANIYDISVTFDVYNFFKSKFTESIP